MSKRYPGGYLTASPVVPTSTAAPGVWTLEQQYQANGAGNWPAAANYQINNSLRFRSSASANLTRTPASTGNRQKWTWSAWVKLGILGSGNETLFSAGTTSGESSRFYLRATSDTLQTGYGSANYFSTSNVYRDPSAWYHIVLAYDSTQATASNRILLYVNNVLATYTFGTNVTLNNSGAVNNTVQHDIGYDHIIPGAYFDGYLTEVNFIDGQQLTPSSFGTTDAYGVWQPIAYSGSYGTNGFYLPFRLNTASTYYGSFSGSSSNLQVANSAVFNAPGTQNFTVEGWYYLNSIPSSGIYGFWGCDNGAGSVPKQTAYIDTSGLVHFDVTLTGGASTATTSTALTTGKWYHLAWVRNGSTFTIYVNGVSAATGTSSVNLTGLTQPFYVGYVGEPSGTFSGLVSNFRYVLGTAIYTANFTPPTSPLTNVSGTVLLTLQNSSIVDNSSNAFSITNNGSISTAPTTYNFAQPTLTADYSGNYNNWANNNISLTSGTTYDSMYDSPTNNSSTVANYCTLNPLGQFKGTQTISNGNLQASQTTTSNYQQCLGTLGVSSGKWYWEWTPTTTLTYPTSNLSFGFMTADSKPTTGGSFVLSTAFSGNIDDGTTLYTYPGGASTSISMVAGDTIGLALDLSAGTLQLYVKGSLKATISSIPAGTYVPFIEMQGTQTNTVTCNFGQQGFKYTAPTGFLPLNTYNLPDSTLPVGGRAMTATTYSGTGTSTTYSNASTGSTGFYPDLSWIKSRNDTSWHQVFDSVRGVLKGIYPNSTYQETTQTDSFNAFTSTGFTLGADAAGGSVNASGKTYVAWQWNANNGSTVSNTNGTITSTVSVNPTAGFSIVSYTGTGANATVGHGLGVAPSMIITKVRSTTNGWVSWHTSLGGADKYIVLSNTNGTQTDSTVWNNTLPTSSVFSIGASVNTNISSATYVAYCWAEVAGFSKFGSYTGNGSTDGPFIYTGFRPKFVMIKCSSTGGAGYDWFMWDSSRNTYNVVDHAVWANLADAENTTAMVDLVSNGFKPRLSSSAMNANGATFIYAAFAESPFKIARAR